MKKNLIICITALFLFLGFSCGDIFNNAFIKILPTEEEEKSEEPKETASNSSKIIDFTANQGKDNREAVLTWINPQVSDFKQVKLLRRTNGFPSGPSDGGAALMYIGTNQRYTDSGLTPGSTYYYSIFSENTDGVYSESSRAVKEVTETITDIRKRSFFIIGGSSAYAVPATVMITSVDMFDPLTETMYAGVATLPHERVFCDVASVNGKIYIFGGYNSAASIVAEVDILDVETLTWDTGTDMLTPRCAIAAAVSGDYIYVLGGSTNTTAAGASALVERYDTSNDSWLNDTSIYPNLDQARCKLVAECINDQVYYHGGTNTLGNWINSGRIVNIQTKYEVAFGGLTYQNGSCSVAYHKELDDGNVLNIIFALTGNNSNTQPGLPPAGVSFTNLVYVCFVPSNSVGPAGYQLTGTPAGTQITNRCYADAECYGDYIYIFGGIGTGSSVLSAIDKLNVRDGLLDQAWESVGTTLATARYGFAVTRLNY